MRSSQVILPKKFGETSSLDLKDYKFIWQKIFQLNWK